MERVVPYSPPLLGGAGAGVEQTLVSVLGGVCTVGGGGPPQGGSAGGGGGAGGGGAGGGGHQPPYDLRRKLPPHDGAPPCPLPRKRQRRTPSSSQGASSSSSSEGECDPGVALVAVGADGGVGLSFYLCLFTVDWTFPMKGGERWHRSSIVWYCLVLELMVLV